MGDRYYSYLDCPKCGSEYELYDAPSSLSYSGVCGKCGWSESREYYKTDEHTIELMTPEEYQSWEKGTRVTLRLNGLTQQERSNHDTYRTR